MIAVDRLRIAPMPGVHTLQADFLAPETAPYGQKPILMEVQM